MSTMRWPWWWSGWSSSPMWSSRTAPAACWKWVSRSRQRRRLPPGPQRRPLRRRHLFWSWICLAARASGAGCSHRTVLPALCRAGWVEPIRRDHSATVAARAPPVRRSEELRAVPGRRTVAEFRATPTFLRRRCCGHGCSLPSLCLISSLNFRRNWELRAPAMGIAEDATTVTIAMLRMQAVQRLREERLAVSLLDLRRYGQLRSGGAVGIQPV